MGVEYLGNGNPSGTSLGLSTSEKISFYGETPVVQADTFTSVSTEIAVSTSDGWGYSTSTQADAIVTAVNAMIVALEAIGIAA
jgi:hypothetical protein